MVLGQIAVPEGTTETTQVRTLLGEMDITEALVTADAAHTCVETASAQRPRDPAGVVTQPAVGGGAPLTLMVTRSEARAACAAMG